MTDAPVVIDEIYDVTILGGGPTGLFGAFYAGMRRMKTLIVDALPELGGQLMALYPEKDVFDVGGFPRILAKDLAEACIQQAMQFHPAVSLSEIVQGLERDGSDEVGDIWRLTTTRATNRASYRTRTVVISAGIGAFEPRRLKVPGIERFEEGHGVQYMVRDKMALAGRHALIVGGGDSAMDWALNLQGITGSLALIHRRNEFRAHEGTIEQVRSGGAVEILTPWELRAVEGNTHLERVTIFQNQTQEERVLEIDALLINVGFIADLGPIKAWGLEMEKTGILVNGMMETNLPGIYAAGDVATHPGKLDLIATGFGEVAIAVNFAKTHIDPKARAFPGHSTEEKWRT